jgi:hypothetical protein
MEVNTTATINPVDMYFPTSWDMNNFAINPIVFVIILLVFIIYFVLFYSLGNNDSSNGDSFIGLNSDNNNQTTKIISVLVVGILIVLILINVFQYFFNINVTAYLSNLFTSKPEVNVVVDQQGSSGLIDYQPAPVPEIKFKKQVFNIPGNYYTYEDAKALCKAYGSDLANYKQVEDAYKNGAEWCNYGWSDGQMALFPTQQNTFDNLQKIEGHEHDCGRPGINGGYIANPNIKYGVNCYGNKPKITSEEEELMKISSPYPKTQKDIDFQKKINYWQTKVDQILVSPFNYDSWSG